MPIQKTLLSASAITILAASSLAQTPAPELPSDIQIGTANPVEILEASAAWRASYGPRWRTVKDSQTGFIRFLYGGRTEAVLQPTKDSDFADLARVFIGEAYAQFGVNPSNLVLDEVLLLPLGQVGTTDKTTVQFRQVIQGVPVERGLINALFDQSGRLLSLDTVGLPDTLLPSSTRPSRDAAAAVELATEAFTKDTRLEAIDVEVLGLEIVQEELGKLRQGTLAWRVRVGNQLDSSDPKASIYSIAATDAGRVIKADNQIHFFDVKGRVQTLATSTSGPVPFSAPLQTLSAGYMRVTSPTAGTVFTDELGNFNFVGATAPINATFSYVGTFNDVINQAGAEYSLTTPLNSSSGNTVLMNPSGANQVTAQANCHTSINAMRDWTRSINPSDNKSDFIARSNTNLNATCNAFFDGSAVNFFLPGGGCANSASPSVIYHEMGHWMNVRYSSGNGSDGFGEGNSDVFAMYQSDSPIIGSGFFGPGSIMRTGENNSQFCGDSNPGCFGQVHADGQVLMGALWKVRKRANITLGNTQGDALSNLLFNSWMNAFNDGQIKTIIEAHWLTLDDNDGNITNGTPNFDDIDGGFRDQGFPGFEKLAVSIVAAMTPKDTPDENGPYGVSVVMTPNEGSTISNARLFWRINGGLPFSTLMATASNDRFFAMIPGQVSPSKVTWWVTGTNDLGGSNFFPQEGDLTTNGFVVGESQTAFFDNLDTVGDNGWTHSQVLTQDDWQHESPNGSAGDAPTPFSGSKIWGNDLGPTGWNGEYKPNVENFLRSPLVDLTGSQIASLIYRRWLTVEKGSFDQATILVNGNQVWQNPQAADLVDSEWVLHEVDISAFTGQNVQLEWRLKSDGGLEFGGWNIDDILVRSLSPSPSTGLPVYFGLATAGSTIPTIDTQGQPSRLGNDDFAATIKGAPPETTAFIGLGFAQLNLQVLEVNLLVQATAVLSGQTDLFGQFSASVPISSDPALVGLTAFFQGLIEDPGGPSGFSATRGMQITVTP